MGIKEWAEKNKPGGEAALANKAKHEARKAELRSGGEATKAKTGSEATLARKEATLARRAKGKARMAELNAAGIARKAGFTVAHTATGEKALNFEGVVLTENSITYQDQGGPLTGATARVENAADIQRRVTATRLLAIGIFAFAKKKQSGHVYLTVEHPDYEFLVEVPVKKETNARAFAVKINNAAKAAGRYQQHHD